MARGWAILMVSSVDNMRTGMNTKTTELTALQKGDLVLLSIKNLKLKVLRKILAIYYIELFRIIEAISL